MHFRTAFKDCSSTMPGLCELLHSGKNGRTTDTTFTQMRGRTVSLTDITCGVPHLNTVLGRWASEGQPGAPMQLCQRILRNVPGRCSISD